MQTSVKKWFKDKGFGFLANGDGPDIMVRKAALENCQFLKPGVLVEFECYVDEKGLAARKVRLLPKQHGANAHRSMDTRSLFGVMT